MNRLAILSAFAALAFASVAHADPCEAPVSGYRPGTSITGTVRYVGDGDSMCIGQSSDPNAWTEIRLADFYAPELHDQGGKEAKAALDRYLGHRAVCVAVRGQNGSTRSYDRLIATCMVDGKPLGDLLRAAGIREGGKGR